MSVCNDIVQRPLARKKSEIFTMNKHKIVLACDSHLRDYSEKILNLLGDSYSVSGLTKPNADLNTIISFNFKMENFSNNYVVIVCREIKDIGRNDTTAGLHCLTHSEKRTVNTNILILGAPYHFKLEDTSCVNKAVLVFNRKLHKIMKVF